MVTLLMVSEVTWDRELFLEPLDLEGLDAVFFLCPFLPGISYKFKISAYSYPCNY